LLEETLGRSAASTIQDAMQRQSGLVVDPFFVATMGDMDLFRNGVSMLGTDWA